MRRWPKTGEAWRPTRKLAVGDACEAVKEHWGTAKTDRRSARKLPLGGGPVDEWPAARNIAAAAAADAAAGDAAETKRATGGGCTPAQGPATTGKRQS